VKPALTVLQSTLPYLHAAATLYMTGIIWLVQVAHYPLFDRIGRDQFVRYENDYTRRMGWVVGPPMLLELATAIALVYVHAGWLVWIALGLLAVVWLSTIFLQIPQHSRLERGFDAVTHRSLVRTNWIRTLAWSGRSALALAILAKWGHG
jgi:hypothetical protein